MSYPIYFSSYTRDDTHQCLTCHNIFRVQVQ